jgi:hypothetical protein
MRLPIHTALSLATLTPKRPVAETQTRRGEQQDVDAEQ